MINLDPEYFQYYRNDREEGPFLAIEARLRACDSFVFRLPIRETEGDANIAGIAGFAIRPIVSELLPTPEPFTIPPTPMQPTPTIPIILHSSSPSSPQISSHLIFPIFFPRKIAK